MNGRGELPDDRARRAHFGRRALAGFAIMFLLLEVPLLGYLVRPEQTAELVAHMSTWLNANGLRVMGWLVGAVGTSLVVQGIAAAA